MADQQQNIETFVLTALRDFAGDDKAEEGGAMVTDLVVDWEVANTQPVQAALHRLRRKGLAVCYRFTGARNEGSCWLWYPVRGQGPS